MLVTALSKFGTLDERLYDRLGSHVASRMLMEPFAVRDLSVICYAFAQTGFLHEPLADRIAARALACVADATPLELARLLQSFAKAGHMQHVETLWTHGVSHVGDKLLFMAPAELVSAAFAFGQLMEVVPTHMQPRLEGLFERLRYAAVSGIVLFQPKEVISLVTTYARWRVPFEPDDLAVVADRLRHLKYWKQQPPAGALQALCSLAMLVHRNAPVGGHRAVDAAQKLVAELLAAVTPAVRQNRVDLPLLARVVEAAGMLGCPHAREFLGSVRTCLVFRARELDSFSRFVLLGAFRDAGYDEDEDFMLVLREGV